MDSVQSHFKNRLNPKTHKYMSSPHCFPYISINVLP